MTVRMAINGFGRIGRLILRALVEANRRDIDIVAINDLGTAGDNAHLLKFDSVHGPFPGKVDVDGNQLIIQNKKITTFSERDPAKLPWADLTIDVVLECSGRFTDYADAAKHLAAGAKKVLVSAPAKDADLTVVYGVNHRALKAEHRVVSNASCTTNCLAPVAHVLNDKFGIERGYMTTIHAYTGDQQLVDTLHKDPRRARAAALSMIPTSTGAAKAVGLVLPELAGKLDGTAIRVPTPNVSMIDFTFTTQVPCSVESINAALAHAAIEGAPLHGILALNKLPLVSIDFNHHPASSIVDLTQTQVIEEKFARILSWYDNEWGFSNRMLDTAVAMGGLLK